MITRDELITFLQDRYTPAQGVDIHSLAWQVAIEDMQERAALRFDTMESYNDFIKRQGPITGNWRPRIYIGARRVSEA